jgi:L-aminopeptidase/D-esterase-like protein
MALGIAGVRVGTWEHETVPTGCTVVLPPDGTLGAIAVRGQAPGTREAAALGPGGKLTVIHAVVLAGGSAYGLAAADGAMSWLEEQGTGYALPMGVVVPIVGAAIVLDVGVAFPGARPGPAAGRAACAAAVGADPAEGGAGAGAGCTVAKTAGLEHAWRGGQGIAVRRVGDLVVGALVVNNAVGDLVGEDGRVVLGSRAPADVPRWPRDVERDEQGGPSGNTVIGVVVTNARLDKAGAHRVADLAHDGVARAVVPAHTSVDGDALFCLATQQVDASVDRVALLAAEAVEEATRRGPMAAASIALPGGPFGDELPGWASARA